MAPRGRKPKLQDRKTTCVSIEGRHVDFLKDNNIEVSSFLRDSIEALMKNKSSPIEQLKKEIEETKEKIREYEIILSQQEMQLKELEEQAEKENLIELEQLEFEENRREYVKGCIQSMKTQSTYNRLWMEYLMEAWKFANFSEAKEYVKNVWIEEGVPAKRVHAYLRLN